jgi:hypothetical protein
MLLRRVHHILTCWTCMLCHHCCHHLLFLQGASDHENQMLLRHVHQNQMLLSNMCIQF